MNEREREIVIKEAKLAALYDVETALRELMQENPVSKEVEEAAEFISHYIGQRISDVAGDKADRLRLSHAPRGDRYEEERRMADRC